MIMMRKQISVMMSILLICVFFLASCGELHMSGIGSYYDMINNNLVETTTFLLPDPGFIDRFEYVDVEYLYDETHPSAALLEKSIIVFHYSPEVYMEVIEYVNHSVTVLPDVSYEFGGYTFLERDAATIYSFDHANSEFPSHFWMVFYSEENHVVGFLGYYQMESKQHIHPDEDFEGFIRYEFSSMDWG